MSMEGIYRGRTFIKSLNKIKYLALTTFYGSAHGGPLGGGGGGCYIAIQDKLKSAVIGDFQKCQSHLMLKNSR